MYPAELEIEDTTESKISTSYLDLLMSIGRDSQLHTSLYDKRDDFNVRITNFSFLSSNIHLRQPMAFLSPSCYGMPGLAHLLRAARLSYKLLEQGYVRERLKSSLKKFYGRYWDLIKHFECYMTFWDKTIYHETHIDH